MKKNLLLGLFAVAVVTASSVSALELKTPNVGSLKNATSVVSNAAASLTPSSVKGSVSGINTKLTAADATVQAAFNSLVTALSSKEEAAKLKTKINAINTNKNLSASEKSAKVAQVMSDYGTTLKENQDKLSEQLKTASATKRTEVTNAVVALAVASYQYLDIANDAKSIAMSVSTNPTLAVSCATELASLKDTGVILKNNVKSLKDVTTQAVAVAKAGGIEIKIPKQSASKTQKANF